MTKRWNAFTLVELLVVISIIALLLGFLMPALGEVRRSAQMTLDLTHLKEHGTMKENYAAENKSRMPNAPAGRDGPNPSGPKTGSAMRPARLYAWAGVYPYNGWSETTDSTPGVMTALRHEDTYKAYNIAFGQYILDDATGLGLLHEIFTSPGRSGAVDVRDNFDSLRSDPGFMWPTEFTVQVDANHPMLSEGAFVGEADEGLAWALSPSYRYTLAGMYGVDVTGKYESFWGKSIGLLGGTGGAGRVPWSDPQASWANMARWVPVSEMAFPSQKVMFWDMWATVDRQNNYYLGLTAQVPAVLVDGSTRIVRPRQEMPDPNSEEYKDALEDGENWAVTSEITWDFVGGGPAWFAFVKGGPSGRDFR